MDFVEKTVLAGVHDELTRRGYGAAPPSSFSRKVECAALHKGDRVPRKELALKYGHNEAVVSSWLHEILDLLEIPVRPRGKPPKRLVLKGRQN
jgi:hypothetical protein